MKKVKTFLLMLLLITSSLLLLTGCKKKLKMNEEKCEEVVLEYLENKYQTEFEVLEGGEVYGVAGPRGYAEVIVNDTADNKEDRYAVTVYPDGSSDKDKDGYYDSYKVVSDDYMCSLLWDLVKDDLNKLLAEAGLTRFITTIGIVEKIEMVGASGFSAEFPIPSEEKFSLIDLLDKKGIIINCCVYMPESEYDDMLQDKITNLVKPLLSDDMITFSIDVYEEEIYSEIEKLESNIGYSTMRINSIYFAIRDEED